MTLVDFKINKKMEILVEEKYFNSNVQDVTDEYIAISIPINSGEYIPLSKGTAIEVIYCEDENYYQFHSSVLGRKFENIPILLIAKPVEVRKIQRRKYVRIQLISEIKYKNLKNQPRTNPSTIESSEYTKGVLVDLSGGGMRVRVSEEIKLNDFLLVSLAINNETTLIVGQAMRIIKDDDGMYYCGLSFEFLESSTREKIIKHIFQLMREHMKKI